MTVTGAAVGGGRGALVGGVVVGGTVVGDTVVRATVVGAAVVGTDVVGAAVLFFEATDVSESATTAFVGFLGDPAREPIAPKTTKPAISQAAT